MAFALIVGIALVEGLGMLISLSPSNWLDDLLPDVHGDSGLDRVLGWLHLGKVPSLVLLVLFLTGYAVFGYSLQKVAHGLLGFYLPVWIAGLVAVAPGMATVRSLGAMPLSTALTYLWPSVPPKSLASSMHSLSTTRQGTSGHFRNS